MRLMGSIRQAVIEDRFPAFVNQFMRDMYSDGRYPEWATDALASVNIHLV